MTRRTRRIYGYSIAGLSALLALLFLANPGLARDPDPPEDVGKKAAWLTDHPADWLTASEIADRSLDTTLPRRRALWHAAYDLAIHVAPRRPNGPAAFVRAGLFHWYELGSNDRKQVLDVAAPLLHEPRFFGLLHAPLFELTRNFAYLRRNAPQTKGALTWLSDLAVMNGLFPEYRELRDARRKEREAAFRRDRHIEHPAALIDLLPDHLDAHDEPLIRGILEEIDRKPFDATSSRRSEDLVLFAIRNHLQPLQALAPLIEMEGALSSPTRARLALALGNAGLASKVELTSSLTRTPEWVPYHLERAVFEARNGDRPVAAAYLARTTLLGIDVRVLTSAEEIARILGDTAEAGRLRGELLAASRNPRDWKETCAENELCDRAVTRQYVADSDRTIRIGAAVVESDAVAPYLEVFVDDALVAEGEVKAGSVFAAQTTAGLHRIEVRLVNRITRNHTQRRVRLS
jgi:hypothetical protein